MKFFLLFLATCHLFFISSAQTSDTPESLAAVSIPQCSITCLAEAVPPLCGSLTNITCICANSKILVNEVTPCVSTACNVTSSLQLLKYVAVTCNVKEDKSHMNMEFRLFYTLPAIVTVLVAFRLWSRWKLAMGIGYDDYLILAAWVAFMVNITTGIQIAMNGFGRHTYYLTTDHVSTSLMYFYISEMLYILTITLTKLSLLMFFRRLFPSRAFLIAIRFVGAFIVASNFSIVMAFLLQCLPFKGNWLNWMYKEPPYKCINSYVAIFFAAGMSIFHDIVLILMPLHTLWSLNLTFIKKLNLLVLFSVGSFVIVCSLLRLPTLLKLKGSSDPSYDLSPISVWTFLEEGSGIICACLPAARSAFGYYFPGLKMTLISSKNTRDYNYQNSQRKKSRGTEGSYGRTFVELNDLSKETYNQSKTRSLNSQESKAPLTDVPVGKQGPGVFASVTCGKDTADKIQNSSKLARDIVITRTVHQS